ncbi:MAG: 7-carboxy-7-deazaguanine synthase QueE [Candidatus Margulisbacteria bacterium]|jgi:7-carboxy-7-deazaguanine synthase|nr:7-carboxy-7-deazaguanine synthase QueE [Candidatus Margulisiibacteriota bacterium]
MSGLPATPKRLRGVPRENKIKMQANLQEIFRSIQGEGLYAGAPTTFVRFSGCNLRCAYCDTKKSWRETKYCLYQPVEFARRLVRVPNAVSAEDCADMIFWLAPRGLVSFTGGEPLLQAKYIARVLQLLGANYTYLIETNGSLPAALKHLPNLPNIVYSIDLKAPQFLRFYKNVPQKSAKYLKIILEKNLAVEKILRILDRIKMTSTPLFLQPLNNRVAKKELQKWMYYLEKNGYVYKVMPQIHKFVRWK